MNRSPVSSLIAEPTAVDPTEFWKSNDKPRFPATISDWDRSVLLPDRPIAKIVGGHAYDLVINRKARRPATRTLDKLLVTFRADFDKASEFFDPAQWRLLYYLDQYPLSALSGPSFDPVRAFRDIYFLDDWHADVPPELIGSTESSLDMVGELRAYRCEIEPDVAKAAWAILSFAHSLKLHGCEVIQLPWWQVWWIERCIAAYR